MIFRHRKCKFFTLAFIIYLICQSQTVLGLAPAPVDYLVPPPLIPANAAITRFKLANPQNLLPSESRTIPKFFNPQLATKPNDNPAGLMARVARWFGYANQNALTDQQLAVETNKRPYYYQRPQYIKGDKENCYLCSEYPWVPMMQNSVQYPQNDNQWDASKQMQVQVYAKNFEGQQSHILPKFYVAAGGQSAPQALHAASNAKPRAVKFNFPFPFVPPAGNKAHENPKDIQYSAGPFLPIPIPAHLSNLAFRPLYNAQNFLPPITPMPNTKQELPSTEPAHFAENIAEHSEILVDTVVPTEIPPTTVNKDASFEIVKSHQLVDYVSSVEYPASYVPTHSYDVNTQAAQLPAEQHQTNSNINTGHYRYSTLSPLLSQHVPASQILTEPGSFLAATHQQPVQQTDVKEQTTFLNHSYNFLESEHDNYVSASHQNSSIVHQQQQQQYHNANLDAWTLESNDFIYSTSTPEILSTEYPAMSTTELESATQPELRDNEIEFIASVQTNAEQSTKDANKIWPPKPNQRETPKRLLDSPIKHLNGNLGAPKPFTRDPSDLSFRLSPPNHKLSDHSSHGTFKAQTTPTEAPRSSSTYSSIDASGQYAGISPPSLPSTYNSNQILLPFLTSKFRPRPFESTRIDMVTRAPIKPAHSSWSGPRNAEVHTPQESMLVGSHIKPATTIPTTTAKPRTTKYLTKILASNIRQLLHREHEPTKLKLSQNSLDIDINKLQKNIDDWTEQEYTSLSHKPSTPTIRGRSKHIPSEYLPTTPAKLKATRQSKTTKIFTDDSELPSSINNLEPLYEGESTKKYQYTQITDNHLMDFYSNFESLKSKSSTSFKQSTTHATPTITAATINTTVTTTTLKPLYFRPIQIQEPEEPWKKARVSISPKTQEKVYVVTPQPRFSPQRFYSPTALPTSTITTTTTENPLSSFSLDSGFKSPRFLVRPTPGNAQKLSKISDTQTEENSKERVSTSYFSPEWFGLRGLSAYVPADPVEIIDGNSKVLNIVTPTSNLEKTTNHNIMDLTKERNTGSKRKTTIPPSPR